MLVERTMEEFLGNDDFGAVLNCAVRYACGRRTYMPTLVQDFIRPLLPKLDNRTLWCFDQDLSEAAWWGGYGDPQIDKPGWLSFLADVRKERTRRGEELYRPYRQDPPPSDEDWTELDRSEAIEQMCQYREEYHDAMVRKQKEEPLHVRINTHGNPMPVRNGEWTDLYTAETVRMEPMEYKIISLGISMELPEGYYAEVLPRSSTCKKYGIIQANSMGIIDNGYCGDNDIWGFPAVAIVKTEIPKGVRIAQFRLVENPRPIQFEAVDTLGNADRGGFGSTGST